jgi:hypothetical protein
MNLVLRLCSIIGLLAILMASATPASNAATAAYVEPTLLESHQPAAMVIVAASSSRAAGEAVAALGGQITSDLWLIDAVAATLPARQIATLAAAPGVRSIVANHGLKSSDTPVPDVQPTNSQKVWKLRYPVTIDIGADKVQHTRLPSGKRNDGDNVTVAVVDSGVFFDKDVRRELGTVVQRDFLGQADFVESSCRADATSRRAKLLGTPMNGYCAETWRDSADDYGHGTAIASVIWNNFTDADSGVKLGVAPGANVLSV